MEEIGIDGVLCSSAFGAHVIRLAAFSVAVVVHVMCLWSLDGQHGEALFFQGTSLVRIRVHR